MLPTSTALRHVARAAALAGVALGFLTSSAAADAPVDYTPFAPDSIWNLPLRANAPLDPNSASYMQDFLTQELTTGNQWINSTTCGMPIYWADAGAPRVTVKLAPNAAWQDPALKRAWSSVPVPADAKPANCMDQNFAVFQRQPDGTVDEWEFWKAAKAADGSWSARWGGAIKDVAHDSGIGSALQWSDPTPGLPALASRSNSAWNVTAAGFSQTAGVITIADMQRGSIDHALAFAIGKPAAGKARWPAQRWDGLSTRQWALPEGTRLRLDPSLDLSAIKMTPMVRMMAVAAQRYGIVVRDQTGADDVFYTEAPRPGLSSPLSALNQGKYPSEALKAFPWRSLEVLAAPVCTKMAACAATPSARIDVDGTQALGQTVTLDTSNSVLNQPRATVRWDLDGDGTYETDGGSAVKRQLLLTLPGRRTIGVSITDRAGATVTGTTTLDVALLAPGATPAPTTTTTTTPAPTTTTPPAAITTPTTPTTTTTTAPTATTQAPTTTTTPATTTTTKPATAAAPVVTAPATTTTPSRPAQTTTTTAPAAAPRPATQSAVSSTSGQGGRTPAQPTSAAAVALQPAPTATTSGAVPVLVDGRIAMVLPRSAQVGSRPRVLVKLAGQARQGTVVLQIRRGGAGWKQVGAQQARGNERLTLRLPGVRRSGRSFGVRVIARDGSGRPLAPARSATVRISR